MRHRSICRERITNTCWHLTKVSVFDLHVKHILIDWVTDRLKVVDSVNTVYIAAAAAADHGPWRAVDHVINSRHSRCCTYSSVFCQPGW